MISPAAPTDRHRRHPDHGPIDRTERRIVELVQILCDAERELQELTGERLDSVSDANGKTYLLSEAQAKLRANEKSQRMAAELLGSVMDALPADIALIDPEGMILMVNESWKRNAMAGGMEGPQFVVGNNYLEICGRATGEGFGYARESAKGVRAVLQAEARTFSFEYRRQIATEQRWVRFVATPVDESCLAGAVIMNADITEAKNIEEQLVWKTAFLEAQIDSSLDGILIVDAKGKHVLQNQQMIDLWGIPADIVEAKDDRRQLEWAMTQVKNPRQFADTIAYLDEHPDEIGHDELELANGKWLDRFSAPVRGRDGKYYGRIRTCRDITERKLAENALRHSEERLRLITDLVPHGIFAKDAAGRHIFANPALAEIAGLSVEQIVGKTDYDLVSDRAEAEAFRAHDLAVIQSGKKMFISEEARTDLTGRTRYLQTIKIPFTVAETGERAVLGVCMDITERKRAEEALLRQQRELKVLFDLMPAMLCFKDTKNVFLRVNQRLAEGAGRPISEIEGRSAEEVFPLEAAKYYADDLEIIRTGTAKLGIIENLRSLDGKSSWVQTDKVPVRDASGQVTGIVVMIQDITERKRNEEALRHSEGNMAAAQRIAHFGSWEMELANLEDIVSNRVRWSDEIFRIAGYEPGAFEPSNAQFFAHVPVEEHAAIHEAMANAIRERRQYSLVHRLIRPDGEERLVHEVAEVFYDQETGRPLKIIGTTHDITERKRIEERLRRLVDSNVQGVFFWNTQGRITGANDAFLGMIGYTREDLDAGSIGWAAMTPPEYAEADRRALAEAAATGVCKSYEKEYIRKDGSRVPILLGAAMFEDNPNDGVCFVLDLTERKKLEAQFLRAQRMESIGTLAGGIAHDLNNILAPILMSINILQDTSTDPHAAHILETIEISAKRGADIVRQVLSFARGIEGERVEIHIKHLLTDLENIIRDTFPKNIRLHFGMDKDTSTVLGDPTQVHQILLNLCVNARDAMPDGGRLSISVENALLDEHYAAMNAQAKPGNYVSINVTDSGTGIPPDVLEKIFEPFFTTKEVGKGTGLGLSTVIAIVKSHEGFVNVYSEPGKGTTFKVYLPAVDVPSNPASQPPGEVSLPRGRGEMILLVDDEPSLSIIASQTLQAFGYRVLTAIDGADAVAVYLAHRNEVAVVLTDMMMPVMDGPAMIHALRRVNPEVKIIATSGLNANGGLTKLAETGIKHFLTKPYTAETLLKTLRAILEEA